MEFRVYIHPNGEVKIEVDGVKGKQCLPLTKFLEDALGTVEERDLKSEYYTVGETLKQVQKLQNKS